MATNVLKHAKIDPEFSLGYAASDALVFMGGKTLAGDGFVKELEAYRKHGYPFQEMLRPDPEVAVVCGARLSTVRLIV
jgi:hypothetical protein